jgi:hypothetical protein
MYIKIKYIYFLAEGRLPTVTTCGLVLFLPALENGVEFAEAMVFGILNSTPTIDKI